MKGNNFFKKVSVLVVLTVSLCQMYAQTQGSGALTNTNGAGTSGTWRCFIGDNAGTSNTTGNHNSFFGYNAGYSNTTGYTNTFMGSHAGYSNEVGSANTLVGYKAGYNNTSHSQTFIGFQAGLNSCLGDIQGTCKENTFVGSSSGYANTTGAQNTFVGFQAGKNSTTSSNNTYIGAVSGYSSTTGAQNTFLGKSSGYSNTTGSNNVYLGYFAGFASTSSNNTFTGHNSGVANTTGSSNVAYGFRSLYSNTVANYNTALGYQALYSTTGVGSNNTAVGLNAGYNNTTGSNNTFLGYGADVNAGTYSNCAAIGNSTVVSFGNKMFIGNNAITHIQGQVNFTTYSDGRFKTEVTENVKGLEFINKLRPVTYKLNTEALDNFIIQNMDDSIKTLHQQNLDFGPSMAMVRSGFIAQEVEAAAQQVGFTSSIVSVPGNENDPYAMSYAEMVVPLVKAIQELSKTADSLKIVINMCCSANNTRSLIQEETHSIEPSKETTVVLNNKNIVILDQNIPNPFADFTIIRYYLPETFKRAQIIFLDQSGKLIKAVDLIEAGSGVLNVFANDLTSGIYTYALIIDGETLETKKMVKVK